MFRTHQFMATCSIMVALWPMVSSAAAATKPEGNVSKVIGSTPTRRRGETVEIRDLQPFTSIAYIPVGSDLSSIKIDGVKIVKVATKLRSVTNPSDCEEHTAEPAGLLDCTRDTYESRVPALRVNYSYRGQPLASDESGSTYFSFSVYFRMDQISPELQRALSRGKVSRTTAAELFQLTTGRGSAEEVEIDESKSMFCDGYYADGNWVHINPRCEDVVAYKRVTSPSPYVTVRVEPVSSGLEAVTAQVHP